MLGVLAQKVVGYAFILLTLWPLWKEIQRLSIIMQAEKVQKTIHLIQPDSGR